MKPTWIGIVLALISSLALPVEGSRAAESSDATMGEIAITPTVSGVFVDGDNNKFREDWWTDDSVKGGLKNFSLRRDLSADITLETQGRAIIDENDYRIDLLINKRDVGFVRAGYKEYRKYFDDTGGFFNFPSNSSFDLNKDLHLDIGKVFLEAGLTLPNKPNLVVGYEHSFKDGEKSLLEWGQVNENGNALRKKIFPSYKEIDEEVDVVRLEISHDIANVHLGDEFRYENYRLDTRRHDEDFNLDTNGNKTVTIDDNYRHDAFYNTVHAESHLNDKIFVSAGYLFTTLDGDASGNILTVDNGIALSSHDKFWNSDAISFEQDVHIANINAVFGPFSDTTIYFGLQGEKLDKDGHTEANLAEGDPDVPVEGMISSDQNKWGIEETFGVRYTGLPRTTVYAEGRWTQQEINLQETEIEDDAVALDRDTDTRVRRQRYSIGFNSSPLRKTTLAARYRHSYRSNDYDHKVDIVEETTPNNEYSAFILDQDFKIDEVMVKVGFQPMVGLRTSFQYQLMSMDVETDEDTDPVSTDHTTNYDANIYTATVTATPLSGLFVTGLVSYQDIRLTTFKSASGAPVSSYHGDVLSLSASAGMALDARTRLNLQYIYSMSENFEDISSVGLPLGVDNKRHAVIANLERQITDNLSVGVRYGYYNYDDEASDGSDNYTAHLIGATCSMIF